MVSSQGKALQLFVNRLASRSKITSEEAGAILGLPGETKQVPAHIDFVQQGDDLSHACLVVDGLVGRFGQNADGVRQLGCLYIQGDMADLPSVVSPKAAWGLVASRPRQSCAYRTWTYVGLPRNTPASPRPSGVTV